MTTRTTRYYSLALKHHVVREIEAGRLTVSQAQTRYGITSFQSIYRWLDTFGTQTAVKVHVQMKDEQDLLSQREAEIQRLQADKQALESALAQSQVKLLLLESLIAVAEKHVGMEAGAFKKNFGTKA